MKNKQERIPDSTDMQGNEDDEERAQSSERSRGKRRTAREIATMFEQLKQRHIARKKEWHDEREELMKRVQTADESRRVLAEIKVILKNLREELRLEERKRFEMEAEHLDERRRWEAEKTDLVKRIEESAHESDKDGKAVKQLKEKLAEQSRQLIEWQETIQELKKQLLERENTFLREKRELQLGLEKERSSWKKREQAFIDKLRELNSKSSGSNASPTHVDVGDTKYLINEEDYAATRRKSSASSTTELSKYNNFQRTVDDALKQIEKISSELKDIDSRKPYSDRASATPSPRMQLRTSTATSEQSSSTNAPWRTKRRTSVSKLGTSGQALSPDSKSIISSSSALSESPVDLSISLPSITATKVNLRRSPNPDRKVRKINSQGSQFDIIVSSPDAPTPTGVPSEQFLPFANQRPNASQDFDIERVVKPTGPGEFSKDSSQNSTPSRPTRRRNTDDGNKVSTFDAMDKQSAQDVTTAKQGQSALAPKIEESAKRRSVSPRLPKLHQQLLFKKEPSLPLDKVFTQRSFESESLASTDKGKTSEDDPHPPRQDYRSNVRRYPSSKKEMENNDFIQTPKELKDTTTNSQLPGERKKDDAPPVHPKPKISIHKDQEGNIVRVSPADERKFLTPESMAGSEKQYSIAERMGKAGRDWIRKKLNFRDRRPEEHDSAEKQQEKPEQVKKRNKSKTRHRPSSLLRSIGNQRSISSTEDSTDAEQEARRESFLRRSRRKGKGISGSGSSNTASPSRKPKKYTRSKTEASPKDMKNFLTKFKASQSNPNKPSVVKQFELKLLENEVKTLNDEHTGKPLLRQQQRQPPQLQISSQTEIQDIEYLSGEEGDAELDPMSPIDGKHTILPKILDSKVTIREKSNIQTKAGPKAYYRRSMTDFRPSAAPHVVSTTPGRPKDKDVLATVDSKRTAAMEAGELCEKKSVSKLVNRFSSSFDEEGILGSKKPIQNRPGRNSSLAKQISGFTSSQSASRSNSFSSHDGPSYRKRGSVRFETDVIEESEGDQKQESLTQSWRNREATKPVVGAIDSSRSEPRETSKGRNVSQSQRISAPPGQYDSLTSFWERERPPPEKEDAKPGRMKIMSEEMKRKANMLEKALTKGPRKSRRYRRADTQPVHSSYLNSSDEDSDTEGVLDVALPPSTRNFVISNEEDDIIQDTAKMHHIIPPVTGKFSKPAKPGRLPSRWAR